MNIQTARVLLACVFPVLACAACGPRDAPPEQAAAPVERPAARPAPAPAPAITSFDECVAAGNPVMESYPRQCKSPDGRNFTEDVGNRVDKQGLIQVDEPTPNQVIASPLTIHGKARGMWYFEASFPVKLVDAQGATLATGIVQANGDWMTEDFVPFRVTLTFSVPPGSTKGTLILEKSNASGLAEHDDRLVIPVKF